MSSLFPIHTLPRRAWRGFIRRVDPFLVRRAVRSRFWAAVYYGFLCPDFRREQMSFLAGRIAYEASTATPAGSMALLRRNVHRLEKGLLMRPRRVPFALDYIGETVRAFAIASGQSVDRLELTWARDVLGEYFQVNGSHEQLEGYRRRFAECGEAACCETGQSRIPYRRNLSTPLRVDYEGLLDLARRRRSVRWFLPRDVPREAIDRAIKLGALAPSACNRQPFEFRVFDDPPLVQKVISIPYGLQGYGHNVPVVVVVVGRQRNFFSERDRHLIYIDASLAVMGFLFALEVQGISSCCVNWPDLEENERVMSRLLKLEPDERPVMLVVLGYPDPDGMVANSTKKSLSHLRRYNFE